MSSDGIEAENDSHEAAISGNGRFAAFYSQADNLVAGDTAMNDVFTHEYWGLPILDFDGDGYSDYGCYDAAGNFGAPPGAWYFMLTDAGFTTQKFGYNGTVP